MSHLMSAHITTYLPFSDDANARFEDQLSSAGLTRSKLFKKLAPMFLEVSYAGDYAACLIDRHYALNDAERMVTDGPSARPSTESSANIVDERWASNGEVIDFKVAVHSASHAPSPAKFFGKHDTGVIHSPMKL